MPRSRSTHPFAKLADESPLPIYVIDDQRRIVSCNRACSEWLGLSAQQLVGQKCDYAAHETASIETITASALAPPPQAFLGESCTAVVVWRNTTGELERRPATFVSLRGEEPAAVLAVLGEILKDGAESSPPVELAQSDALHERLQQLVRRMRTRYRLDLLVGDSPPMRRVREQVATAIASHVRVLIVGPTGSGREHVARTIVYGDKPDADRTILPLECATLEVESLESSVATPMRRGKSLNSPTEPVWLLLEVDQLSPQVQVELATRLRSPTFRAQVLATARRPLVELTAAGGFHRDLAFALSTLVIELPPLRDRREDIPSLIHRMVEEHNATTGRQLAGFSPAALDRLASLPWTGNVEELAGVVRESCQTVSTVWIGETDLPARVRATVSAGMHPRHEDESIQLDAFLLEVERELIDRAMKTANGNKSQAARLLGVSRPRLLRRLEQLGLVTREETAIDFRPELEDAGEGPTLETQFSKDD
jgi:DNA-binding NtrC family response regulator